MGTPPEQLPPKYLRAGSLLSRLIMHDPFPLNLPLVTHTTP
jgi:hypothetical protein